MSKLAIEMIHATTTTGCQRRDTGWRDPCFIGLPVYGERQPKRLYRRYTSQDEMAKDMMFLQRRCFEKGRKSFVYVMMRQITLLEYERAVHRDLVWC